MYWFDQAERRLHSTIAHREDCGFCPNHSAAATFYEVGAAGLLGHHERGLCLLAGLSRPRDLARPRARAFSSGGRGDRRIIAEGLARSSTHSKRRSNDNLACRVVSRLPPGTSPLHGTHRLISSRRHQSESPARSVLCTTASAKRSRQRKRKILLTTRNLTHLHQVWRLKLS